MVDLDLADRKLALAQVALAEEVAMQGLEHVALGVARLPGQ